MRSFNPDKIWYQQHVISWLLYPFSLLFWIIAKCRTYLLKRFFQTTFNTPIIVVGNITVGGVGKTPLVIELSQQLKKRGLDVGIVSRGYGAKARQFPLEVTGTECAVEVGDEPLLIAQKTRCPVFIAPKRVQAVKALISQYQPDIIISDDGLQHYRLGRSIEIAVIDGKRGLGNGFCLPAGPLREEKARLKTVDYVIVNSGAWPKAYQMNLIPKDIVLLQTNQAIKACDFNGKVAAVAAIGHPKRFFSTLDALGLSYRAYSFPDHYQFKPTDLNFKEKWIVMTEKDAVKCQSFVQDNYCVLPVKAKIEDVFWEDFWAHKVFKDVL